MLSQVIATFNDRVQEIEEYLLLITQESETPSSIINTSNLSIMNASFIVMLYNLIEFTIQSSFLKIFDFIENKKISYNKISPEICERWVHINYIWCHDLSASFNTYKNTAHAMITGAVNNDPIKLTRKALGISGNIDADEITKLCGRFWVNLNTRITKGGVIKIIKDKRNLLTHGALSFTEVGRDYTYQDLVEIKEEAIEYMNMVLLSIDDYAKNELFLALAYRKTASAISSSASTVVT